MIALRSHAPALCGVVLAMVVAPCGCSADGIHFEPSTGTTSAATTDTAGSGGTASGCVSGTLCEEGARCCSGNTVLGCTGGTLTLVQACASGENCNPDTQSCTCIEGGHTCLDPHAQATCVMGLSGPEWEVHQCGDFAQCNGGSCVIPCKPGTVSCSADGAAVIQCDEGGEFLSVLDCKGFGFANGCVNPEPGIVLDTLAERCVNACGTRGVPLESLPCSPVPGLYCSVQVCAANGESLVPDHTGCLPPGAPCDKDTDCSTCFCENKLCAGVDQVAPCPAAIDAGCE